MSKGPKRKPPIERFRKFIKVADNDCWLWMGCRFRSGYGLLSPGGRAHSVYAHRWAYQHFVGPIPAGLEISHKCGNPSCVNPEHLQAVTHRQNLCETKTSTRINAEKTHCVHGHEYTPENTHRTKKGWRACRDCQRQSLRERYNRNREPILEQRRKSYRESHTPPAPRTCCKRGHPFDEKNTYIDSRGDRVCKACRRLAMRRFRLKKGAAVDESHSQDGTPSS